MTETIVPRQTPPCPQCGKRVETIGVERQDDGWSITDMTRVLRPAEMWVNPCQHPVAGYVANEDGIVVEWKS